MATPTLSVFKHRFYDNNGRLNAGGFVYVYEPGSTTPKTTYTDYTAGSENTWPVQLDSKGEAGIWIDGVAKINVTDSNDVQITGWPVDHVGNNLGDTTSGSNGAGLVGFNPALTYSANSVGAWLKSLLSSIGSSLIGFIQSGVDAVLRTTQDKLRETVSVMDFGAVGDGSHDDTAAIKAAIDAVGAAGGGEVYFPAGTYIVSNQNPGAPSWDNKVAIWILQNNIRLRGAGVSATKLKLANSANAHVIKFGQRVGGSVSIANGAVSDMEIDGNRANQVTPTGTDDHQQGIDVATGSTGIHLERLYVHDTVYYGIGFQRDDFHNCVVRDVITNNTGADGLDWKDDSDANTGNIIDNLRVSNYGLVGGLLTGQAGLDMRTGITATKIVVTDPGAGAEVGIRLQNGTPGSTPVQPTRLSNFYVAGTNAVASVGVRVSTNTAEVSDGKAIAFADGFSLSDPDNRFSNLYALSNGVGFRLWQNAAAGAEADTAFLGGIFARNNTQAGIVYDSVDEITVIGADVRNNGIGHDIRAGSTNIRIIGGSCTGNTTNVSDSGAGTFISSVSGYRTKNVVNVSVAIDSTGIKSIVIAHGLPFTPNNADVTLTLRRNTNVGDWSAGFLWVTSCDATNINGQLMVLTASATAGAVVDVVATVESKNR